MERFFQKVNKTDGCWLWTGCKLPFGHGQFRLGGSAKLAHRVSWEIHNGTVPEGQCVLHKCDVPACVNPDHLFLGDRGDNIRDCFSKGRAKPENGLKAAWEVAGDYNLAKTHCPQGHEYTTGNIRIGKNKNGNPSRGCKTCHRLRERARQFRIRQKNIEVILDKP